MDYDIIDYNRIMNRRSAGNIDVVISEIEDQVGSFQASNAYGAKANVTQINRITKGIYDRPSTSIYGDLFAIGQNGTNLLKMKMHPDGAKLAKSSMIIAFLVSPRTPYILSGVGSVGRTTIHRPIAITNHLTILISDIQCAFFMTKAGKVFAGISTN